MVSKVVELWGSGQMDSLTAMKLLGAEVHGERPESADKSSSAEGEPRGTKRKSPEPETRHEGNAEQKSMDKSAIWWHVGSGLI